MNTDIQFTGLSSIPSSYNSPDGQLDLSLNLLHEDGALRPILPPKPILDLPQKTDITFIHKTSSFTHYILHGPGNTLSWIPPTGGEPHPIEWSQTVINRIDAIGNTLLIFTPDATHYILWKTVQNPDTNTSEEKYLYLGSHIPKIEISFGLVGHPRFLGMNTDDTITIELPDNINLADIDNDFSDSNSSAITETVMANLNRFIAQQTIEKGRFCFPFLLRYAIRLYDGSLVLHSAPILMNPSTTVAPYVIMSGGAYDQDHDRYETLHPAIMLVAADIDYLVNESADLPKLSDWKDIISGIEVFISKPIYTYDQSGKIKHLTKGNKLESSFIGRLYHDQWHRGNQSPIFPQTPAQDCVRSPMPTGQDHDYLRCYTQWSYHQILNLYCLRTNEPLYTFQLPEFSEEKIEESIRSCAQFYKLHTISIDDAQKNATDLNTSTFPQRKTIPIEEDYLQSLLTREVMTDDYLSHDTLTALSTYVYNARLNLSGVKRTLFRGFSPATMFAHTDRDIKTFSLNPATQEITIELYTSAASYSISFYINEGGRYHSLTSSAAKYAAILSPDNTSRRSTACLIFYPNVNATHAVINGPGAFMVIPLRKHEFLNGAVAFIGYNTIRKVIYSLSPHIPYVAPGGNGTVDIPNKLYTSEVNNPFFFPLTGINTIGTGRILGISSAAKALSQGQFGQFPLYAFTDQGVWALEVSTSGTFTARQPITRDICISPQSITQIDSAVLFPTDRGIMLISGSQAQPITDPIITLDSVPNEMRRFLIAKPFVRMQEREAVAAPGSAGINPGSLPDIPFREYIRNCRIAYDYTRQRIIIFNPDKDYAYIHSLRSQQWGMMQSSLHSSLNAYPQALAIEKYKEEGETKKRLVNLSDDAGDSTPFLLSTRPIKFSAPDLLKTIRAAILRGIIPPLSASLILYATRDHISFHAIASSRSTAIRAILGTPYRAFRLLAGGHIKKGQCITSASFTIISRFPNRPL